MTVTAYNKEGLVAVRERSNDTQGIKLRLKDGEYEVLTFNYSDFEFGSMTFIDMDKLSQAWVSLNPILMRPSETWDEGVTYVREPEAFYVGLEKVNIKNGKVDGKGYEIFTSPKNLNSTFYIEVSVSGIENMKSVEGSISGMAAGCRLFDGRPSEARVVHLLTNPKAKVKGKKEQKSNYRDQHASEENIPIDGIVRFKISCFGLPFSKQYISSRSAQDNVLKLHFKLRDNKTELDYKFNVGKLIRYLEVESKSLQAVFSEDPTKYLFLQIGEDLGPTLPFVIPEGDQESGFDAEVSDWEDGGEIIIDV